MALKPELLTALFEKAAEEELGLVIETQNPKQMQILLCHHRKEYGLTKFENLVVAIPSEPNTVFISKKSVDLDA